MLFEVSEFFVKFGTWREFKGASLAPTVCFSLDTSSTVECPPSEKVPQKNSHECLCVKRYRVWVKGVFCKDESRLKDVKLYAVENICFELTAPIPHGVSR